MNSKKSEIIGELRRKIDSIDEDLLVLINNRMRLAKEVGAIKEREGQGCIIDPTREAKVIDRLVRLNRGPLEEKHLRHILTEIIAVSRQIRFHGKRRFMRIDSATRLYAVLGDPVAHSLSPLMHNCAFEEKGLNGVYVALRVTDPKGAVAAVKSLGLAGCSITIPHKTAVLPFLEEVTPFARQVGAVNTIINRDGYLTGDNTDGPAALAALQSKIKVAGKKVALIGAGGAARGVGHALCAAGAAVTILNRSVDKGERLAQTLSADFAPLAEVDQRPFDVLVNTTSMGMYPDVRSSPLNEYIYIQNQVIMDIIYNPLETRLIARARRKGCMVIDGAEMFVRQGALQFELWTGVPAPYEKMETAVRQELSSS